MALFRSFLVLSVAGILSLCGATTLIEGDRRTHTSLRRLGALLSSTRCESYSLADCNASGISEEDCPVTEQVCPQQRKPGFRVGCMAVWQNGTDGFKLQLKRCWSYQVLQVCLPGDSCVAAGHDDALPGDKQLTYFCCCAGDMCNADVRLALSKADVDVLGPSAETTSFPPYDKAATLWDVLTILIPIILLAVIVVAAYFIYRKYQMLNYERKHRLDGVPQMGTTESILLSSANRIDGTPNALKGLKLDAVVAKGRYGQVYRGRISDRLVAVKVFPSIDVDSWVQEKDIYGVMGMREHANIVTYIESDVRGSPELGQEQYWLVTDYMHNGALTDYLKDQVVTLYLAARIGADFLCGLAFLHDVEIESGTGRVLKPTIVHRDFKSRNVLLDSQLRAKIADFGLAIKCDHGQMPGDIRTQTGTRRYMAPEVLECYTEFSGFAFRQIDAYAAGLVLWELVNRARIGDQSPDEYKLPFQDDVGLQPSLTEMKQCVCDQKRRPAIEPHWKLDKEADALVCTMSEMWDHESEARLTPSSAYERLQTVLKRLAGHGSDADDNTSSSCATSDEHSRLVRHCAGQHSGRRHPPGLVESDDIRLQFSNDCRQYSHGRDLTDTV